jgi:SAM-dependent methyltransferase
MPREDAERWNERYTYAKSKDFQTPHEFLLEHIDLLPSSGIVLDIAMGVGKNIPAILNKGLDIIGVDISSVAVRQVHARYPQIKAIIADLTHFYLPSQHFDLILNFYYLQRDLWIDYRRILKPGGLLVFESLTMPMQALKPELNADYLLQEGELAAAFDDWDILVYREGWNIRDEQCHKSVASMIARRPS